MKRFVLVMMSAALLLGQAGTTNAPQTTKDLVQEGGKALQPADLDKAIQQLYAVISGPAGQKRDPDAFRNMFVKEHGRLMAIGKNPKTGEFVERAMSPDEYIANSYPFLEKNGFYEREISRRTERFGDIVHVWSTYESRHKPDEQPFARGINSIQLVNDGSGWKIVSILWEGERPDLKLPEQYVTEH